MDLALLYLDDGVVAGSPAVVGSTDAASLGAHLPRQLLETPDGASRVTCNFGLLGAAVGDAAYVAAYMCSRAAKANALLDAIGQLEDPTP